VVRHVQIADAPGRHQPGTGELDLGGFLSLLDELEYDGVVGLEFVPQGPTAQALEWLPRAMRA